MLDEPLTGLDPRGIRTMQESIRSRAAAGAAVMVSSHLLSLVEDLCTSILLMHRGRKLLHGRLADLRREAVERTAGPSRWRTSSSGSPRRPRPPVAAGRRGPDVDRSLWLLMRLRAGALLRRLEEDALAAQGDRDGRDHGACSSSPGSSRSS